MHARRGLGADEYRLLLERSPSMLRRAGVDGRCDYVNDTWLAFTGRDAREELGDGWTRGIHPDDYALCVDLQRAHFDQRRAFETEYRLRRHDGAYRRIRDRHVPLFDDRGWFVGYLGTCTDCEDEHQAQETKARFLVLMTQDLRVPLTAAKHQVEYLSRRARRRQPLLEADVERLSRQVDRLVALVEQLAVAARIETRSTLLLDRHEVDLTELVVDLVSAKTRSLRERRVTGAPGVGIETPAIPRLVQGDGVKLAQALECVMDNAVKFSRGGRVRVSLTSSARYYAVSVSDDGIGIPEECLESVTVPYVRGNNASRYPGAGLGLAIAREIVEAHRGRIQVDPNPSGGTRVTVILPKVARAS
jgi:two-component system CheB/CheR fusion protein